MKLWNDGKPYYSVNQYYKDVFGQKIYKISLDIGCTCPTRDGTKSFTGCTFCSAKGSGDFAIAGNEEVRTKMDMAIKMIQKKSDANSYVAYLQSFTNTYGPEEKLISIYEEILSDDRIVGLAIGTRPDCISDSMLLKIKTLSKVKPIWIELGLQTIHEKTSNLFNRGYTLDVFDNAVIKLNKHNIPIVVHLIVGLMGESYENFIDTIDYISKKPISGVKMAMLHILEDSPLGDEYKQKPFNLLDKETYIKWIADAITKLPQEFVIHRITGDGAQKNLIAPKWSCYKRIVFTGILQYMFKNKLFQGSKV